MQGALFCSPEKILSAPFWDNPLITRNNKAIKHSAFPALSTKILSVTDFYKPGTCMLYTRDELITKYDIVISQETMIEIHYIIKNARRNLGLQVDISSEIVLPFQPLLMNIVNLTKTGCSVYYRMLRKKTNLKTTLSARENKWHLELGCTFGVDFWNRTYSLVSKIKFENK